MQEQSKKADNVMHITRAGGLVAATREALQQLANEVLDGERVIRNGDKIVVEIETADISVAGRILAEFSDQLREEQRVPDSLGELARLTNRFGNVLRTPAWSTFSNGQVVALGRSGG